MTFRLASAGLLALALFLSSCRNPENPQQENWIRLFNGKDLAGWDVKITGHELNDNFRNNFRVQDSVLKVDYSEWSQFDNQFGHLYYKTPYSHYRVRLQYRFTGEQLKGGPDYAYLNSGIMLHSQSAASVQKDQSFPVSLEMQFLASDPKQQRPTGNLCTPGTEVEMGGQVIAAHCVDAHSASYMSGEWVTAEAIVLGDSVIHHVINGDTVLTYNHPHISEYFVNANMTWTRGGFSDSTLWVQKKNTPLKEGYLALQAESHPIEFRNIELLNLKGCMDRKAKNYRSYFVKGDAGACQY